MLLGVLCAAFPYVATAFATTPVLLREARALPLRQECGSRGKRSRHARSSAAEPESLSRRALVTALPAIVPAVGGLLPGALAARAGEGQVGRAIASRLPIGYRSTTVAVGGENIPVAQWYPLSSVTSTATVETERPYQYQIGIANLFKAFLGFKLPIPSPTVASGDVSVRVGGAAVAQCKHGIVFAHGMLGSRFDMADLCAALAREGFVVSAADFAESISASFTPNEATSRSAIIDAELALLQRYALHLPAAAHPSGWVPHARR